MSRLFEQLKKRHVFRTLLTYLALSWVLLQVVDLVASIIGLPDGTVRVLAGILAIGILPVAIFSWIYEITPEGLKKESEVSVDEAQRQNVGSRLNIAVIVLVSVAIVLLAVDRFLVPEQGVVPTTTAADTEIVDDGKIDSIAVLPFSDFSPTGDQAYLGDGIADTVLHLLAGVDGLRVAARTSSFKFRGQDVDITTIGEQLKVESVLEGSVQISGEQMRIIAQLVRTSDQSHIWSKTFDGNREDIFAVQDEIANAVVAEFSGAGEAPPATLESQTTSPEVYALVLQARHLTRNRNAADIEQAIELLNRAIATDPSYAPAHSEMAGALIFSTMYGSTELDVLRPRIEGEIETALQLDANDSNAYAMRGVLSDEDQDLESAITDYERAIALNPTDVETMSWLGNNYRVFGDVEKARETLERAYETDPLNVAARSNYSLFLVEELRDIDSAIALAEETVALNLNPGTANLALATLYMRVSRLADVATAFFAAAKANPTSPQPYGALSLWMSFMEDRALFEQWRAASRQLLPSDFRTTHFSMRLFAGEAEQLLEEVEQALAEDPDSQLALIDVSDVAGAMGQYERALEAGEHYFELARESGPMNPMTHFTMAMDMAVMNRRLGRMEESAFFVNLIDGMMEMMAGQATPGDGRAEFMNYFANIARGDFDAVADFLDSVEVGKPILYGNIRHDAVFSETHENPRIRKWMDEYAALIVSEREKLQLIEDPAFHNPRLLLEGAAGAD